MKQQLSYILSLILLFTLSCSTNSQSSKERHTYVDGDYYAEVKYYNPKTSTKSTYTLRVKIKDDKLIIMYFSNGGWLDDTHFTPPDISAGGAKFKTDRNYRYDVTILERVDGETYQEE